MRAGDNGHIEHWYAIHTKPKQEARAYSNLRAWGVETLTLKIKERRFNSVTKRVTSITKPLFSRYIFAKFNPGYLLHKVCFTAGVQSVVCCGGRPCPVDDELIALLQSRADEDGFIRIDEDLLPGDRVIINNGYLKDFAGILEAKLNEQDRVRILLTTINYQGHVVVQRDWVRKVS